jgi:CubicO group peptidase (beta-lactamase class C family)
MSVAGTWDPRFSGVADALRENVASRGELGAAVAVSVDGRLVVDVWTGWAENTLVDVFSVGKAMAALCVLRLAGRGQVDLDAPVRRHWPELTADATVAQVLSHQAGLPAVGDQLPGDAMYDWELMTSAIAAQEPWWEPGTAHGYHVMTFGFLVGELVRRVTGERLRDWFSREIANPLEADLAFGVRPADRGRTADYLFTEETTDPSGGPPRPVDERRRTMIANAYFNPPGISGLGTVNTDAWRDAEMPSTNLHATARGVARVLEQLAAGGGSLLDGETLARATAPVSDGDDLILGRPSRFGLGFQLTEPERPLGPNPGSFGHFGVGGSLGFADPGAGIAFAYVMDRGGPRWRNPRQRALIDAVYEAL